MRGGPGYVKFHDGTRIEYDQPLNTLDPRYLGCIDHRTACICREAEWSEEVREYSAEWEAVRRAIAGGILAGHPGRAIHLSHLIREKS